MKKAFTKIEDDFIRNNIDKCNTLYDLVDLFNANFPAHPTSYSNLQKRMARLGIKKGTHNLRKKPKSKNPIGTIITYKDGTKARVKTENGYVQANGYFKKKYFGDKEGMLIHLNGNLVDFSESNLVLVSRYIYSSLCWRRWIFTDPELTKAAILTAELLSFFPELTHNENQYYKRR